MRLGDNRGSRRLDSFDRDTQVAVRMVRDATHMARSLEGRLQASIKSDTSPVTIADLAIQAVVAERLGNAFPNDPLIAEEDAALLRADQDLSLQVVDAVRQTIRDATVDRIVTWIGDGTSTPGARFWLIDPIDGTKGFLHGRQYVIALALVVNSGVQLSVIGCPRLSLVSGAERAQISEQSADGGIAIAVRGTEPGGPRLARIPAIGLRSRRVVMPQLHASCSHSKAGMEIQNASRASFNRSEMSGPRC